MNIGLLDFTTSGGFPLCPSLRADISFEAVRGYFIPNRFPLEGGVR